MFISRSLGQVMDCGTGGRADPGRTIVRISGGSSDASRSLPGRAPDRTRTRNGCPDTIRTGHKTRRCYTTLSYTKVFAPPAMSTWDVTVRVFRWRAWGLSLFPLLFPQGVRARGCARGRALAAGFCSNPSRMSTRMWASRISAPPACVPAWALRLASRQGLLGDVVRSPPPAASFSSRSTPSVSIAVLSEGEV